ncbi:MAG: LlaMI family restriction endonuclease, partial [Culicoidibacterales bacterium]
MEDNKRKIIIKFVQDVKGKKVDVTKKNKNHDGRKGHWLEKQFDISANGNNSADILGYELKNETTSGKTTFGDWSANEYIFKKGRYKREDENPYVFIFQKKKENGKEVTPQDLFCRMFGKPNEQKNGRYSWSGNPVPKLEKYNDFGQIMLIEENLDIVIYYSYQKDMRENKDKIVAKELQKEKIQIARWYGEKSPTSKRADKSLKSKLEDKFNDAGWFTCKTNPKGEYYKICFGEPITFKNWIKLVKEGIVFFDSGMYETN